MRRWLLVSVLVFTAATAASAQQRAPAHERPLIGRCHMGGCGWFRVHGRAVVRDEGGERLLRLNIAEGGSVRLDQDHPERVPVRWNPPHDDYYFLCSAARPTVIHAREGGGWSAFQLDFVNGPAGATTAASAQYVAACHPGEDMFGDGFAARHGYRGSEPAEERVLARPEDIFAPAG